MKAFDVTLVRFAVAQAAKDVNFMESDLLAARRHMLRAANQHLLNEPGSVLTGPHANRAIAHGTNVTLMQCTVVLLAGP